MLSLSINQNQFSDLLNLNYGVFLPLKNFVNEKNFRNILIKKKIDNKFFPIPIFFGIKKIDYNKIKNSTKIKIIYKRKLIAIVRLKSLFKIDHKIYGKKIFGKNFKNHSYYIKFKKENYAFIDLEYIKLEKKNLKDKNFVPPIKFKKRINFKNKKKKNLAGFHTRNVPHSAHQWIHQFLIKKYSNILIQPLIGQYKKNEYLDQIIKKTNLIAIKMYPRKKAFYLPYFSYPRYGGPLEASLHAIVRKNYGCTHFWVGRDHAGYKNFYSKYASQNFCKKNQKRLGINIIAENEPYFCSSCKLIVNKQCKVKKCVNAKKIRISGTKIRNLVKRNKPVPEILMKKEISIILDKKSII
tara:strand:+ start:2560 stop:3618 length:1059 start_codon:yes stop_codon:yes gene_type:complete